MVMEMLGYLADGAGRDDRQDAADQQVLPDVVAVVTLVRQQRRRLTISALSAARLWCSRKPRRR